MLEKNSQIVLTQEDVNLYNAGIVSKRVQEQWGLSLADLKTVIENNDYTKVDNE